MGRLGGVRGSGLCFRGAGFGLFLSLGKRKRPALAASLDSVGAAADVCEAASVGTVWIPLAAWGIGLHAFCREGLATTAAPSPLSRGSQAFRLGDFLLDGLAARFSSNGTSGMRNRSRVMPPSVREVPLGAAPPVLLQAAPPILMETSLGASPSCGTPPSCGDASSRPSTPVANELGQIPAEVAAEDFSSGEWDTGDSGLEEAALSCSPSAP